MKMSIKVLQHLAMPIAASCLAVAAVAQTIPNGAAIDAEVSKIMTRTHAKGMAVAVIDHGKVGYVHAYGIRNAKGDPLTTDTVMYGASLTKTVFAYTVMQLVDQGKLNLDTPLKDDLDNPLPTYGPDPVFPDKYGPYKDLAGRSALGKDHAAYVPDPFDRLQQLLVHRTRPEAAHPFRTRHALTAIRAKASSCCNSSSNTAARRRVWGSMSAI